MQFYPAISLSLENIIRSGIDILLQLKEKDQNIRFRQGTLFSTRQLHLPEYTHTGNEIGLLIFSLLWFSIYIG